MEQGVRGKVIAPRRLLPSTSPLAQFDCNFAALGSWLVNGCDCRIFLLATAPCNDQRLPQRG